MSRKDASNIDKKMSRSTKKPKTGAKAVAHSCRNNGTCDYCKSNRLHKHKREESKNK